MLKPFAVAGLIIIFACSLCGQTAAPAVRATKPDTTRVLVSAAAQPPAFRYLAFPSLLKIADDEVWLAYKAGLSHATDAGAAIEVVSHNLSTAATKLVARMPAPPPKLYQMAELVRFPDGAVAMYVDVQSVGWDGRHYRSGAEVMRWQPRERRFTAPTELGPINQVLYGYPLDFGSEGSTTWQLIMAFGYHLPNGRWSVDALRSEDNGRSWTFVRNLTDEFGKIRANESAFVRHRDGFIVTTRGYDRIERLHLTDAEFRVRHQVELTGKYPFVNSYVGRPRLFVRDGHGYMIGRNWTQPIGPSAERAATTSPMQLCLLRFDPDSLVVTGCVILDNADQQRVTDGYYAVTAFSGHGDAERLHVFTYKALNQQPPDIVRLDYRWSEVK